MDGWIEHTGDTCPVPRGTLIDIIDNDGFMWTNERALECSAAKCFWENVEDENGLEWENQIKYYRIVAVS